jgi:chemotaxis protein MotB
MVEPSGPGRSSRRLALEAFGLGLAGLVGCSVVPKTRLDDCHRLSQALQVENAQLKDVKLSIQAQNQDLTLRAVEDGRRIKVQDEAIRRLERSVTAYQSERDQLSAAFDRIKHQLQASANPLPTAMIERFRTFAEQHSGCAFDPETAVLTIPSASLFEPGSDRPRPEALRLIRAAAERLNDPEARDLDVVIVGHTEPSAVVRTGLDTRRSNSTHLGLDRASRVRALLTTEGGLDVSRIEVAGHEAPPTPDAGQNDGNERRIEIQLKRRETAPRTSQSDP